MSSAHDAHRTLAVRLSKCGAMRGHHVHRHPHMVPVRLTNSEPEIDPRLLRRERQPDEGLSNRALGEAVRVSTLHRNAPNPRDTALPTAQLCRLYDPNCAVQHNAAGEVPPAVPPSPILCFKHRRKVAKGNTVKFKPRTLQLLPTPERPSYARATLEVPKGLNGRLSVRYEERIIAAQDALPSPQFLRNGHEPYTVPRLHPWA